MLAIMLAFLELLLPKLRLMRNMLEYESGVMDLAQALFLLPFTMLELDLLASRSHLAAIQ
jgi:hypothetical protein